MKSRSPTLTLARMKTTNPWLWVPVFCALLFPAFVFFGCGGTKKVDPPGQDPTPMGAEAAEVVPLAPEFQRGVNFAHIHRRGHGYGSSIAARELDSLKRIGVTWIAITPFGYQDGATADGIFGYPGAPGQSEFFHRTDPSLNDSDLTAQIDSAHSLGIKVTVKPDIWSRDFWNGEEWHGTIRQNSPEAHERWWKSFRDFSLHFAWVSAEAGADEYCLGTELVRMTTRYPEEWRALIADIRKVYRGPLTYAAHWESEYKQITFWNALDFIGITAYFPLDAPDDADVQQLVTAWQPYRKSIADLSTRFNRPVLFLEAGYPAVEGTYRAPWEYRGKKTDTRAQAIAYEALFTAFAPEEWWKGIYLWKDFTDPGLTYERRDRSWFSFRRRPAEDVVRRWFTATNRVER